MEDNKEDVVEQLISILYSNNFFETKLKNFNDFKDNHKNNCCKNLVEKEKEANKVFHLFEKVNNANKGWDDISIKNRAVIFKKILKEFKKMNIEDIKLINYFKNLYTVSLYNLEILKYNKRIEKAIEKYNYLFKDIDVKYGKGKYLSEDIVNFPVNEFDIQQGTEERYIFPNMYFHQDYISTCINEEYLGIEGSVIFSDIDTNVESDEWGQNKKLSILSNKMGKLIEECRIFDTNYCIEKEAKYDNVYLQSFLSLHDFRNALDKQASRLEINMKKIMEYHALMLDILIGECDKENKFLEIIKEN